MPDTKDLALINAVIAASLAEAEEHGISLTGSVRRLFELVNAGERDFEVLKAAVLNSGKRPPPR